MLPFRTIRDICINGNPEKIVDTILQNKYPNNTGYRISRKIMFMKEHHGDLKRCIPELLQMGLYDNLCAIMKFDDRIVGMIFSEIDLQVPGQRKLYDHVITNFGHIHYILLSECVARKNIDLVRNLVRLFKYELKSHSNHVSLKLYNMSSEMFWTVIDYSSKDRMGIMISLIKHDRLDLLKEFICDHDYNNSVISEKMIPYIRSKNMYDYIVPKIKITGPLNYCTATGMKYLYRSSRTVREMILELFYMDPGASNKILMHYFKYCPEDFLEKFSEVAQYRNSFKSLLSCICRTKKSKMPEKWKVSMANTVFKAINQHYGDTQGNNNRILFMCPAVFEQMKHEDVIYYASKYSLQEYYATLSVYWANYFRVRLPQKISIVNKLFDLKFIF